MQRFMSRRLAYCGSDLWHRLDYCAAVHRGCCLPTKVSLLPTVSDGRCRQISRKSGGFRMGELPAAGYLLIDPRPLALESQYTFFLPSAEQVAALCPGDLVKLMFEHIPTGVQWGIERMWVTVARSEADRFTGELDNQPFEPTARLRVGDEIVFYGFHILDVRWNDTSRAPAPPERREYWDRCLVDASVIDGSAPIEFIYREMPNLTNEGDEFPDSGWRIRGRSETGTKPESGSRKPQYVAMGAVLNRDDSWLPYIDAPVGARLVRSSSGYVDEAS